MTRYQLLEYRADDQDQSIAWVRDTSDGLYSRPLHQGEDWAATDADGFRVVDVALVEAGSWDCIYDPDEAGLGHIGLLTVRHEWDGPLAPAPEEESR